MAGGFLDGFVDVLRARAGNVKAFVSPINASQDALIIVGQSTRKQAVGKAGMKAGKHVAREPSRALWMATSLSSATRSRARAR